MGGVDQEINKQSDEHCRELWRESVASGPCCCKMELGRACVQTTGVFVVDECFLVDGQ